MREVMERSIKTFLIKGFKEPDRRGDAGFHLRCQLLIVVFEIDQRLVFVSIEKAEDWTGCTVTFQKSMEESQWNR